MDHLALFFAAAVIYLPPLQTVFATAPLLGWTLASLLPIPIIVWGVGETYASYPPRSAPTCANQFAGHS